MFRENTRIHFHPFCQNKTMIKLRRQKIIKNEVGPKGKLKQKMDCSRKDIQAENTQKN